MTSRTETAMLAMFAVLQAKAAEDDHPLPVPLRNEDLVSRIDTDDSTFRRYLNLWDGDGGPVDETLGADEVGEIDDTASGGYEIEHRAVIEFAICDGTSVDREAAFDACLIAIHEALRPSVVGDVRTYLGGAVDYCAIESIKRTGGGSDLATDGLPNIKAAEIVVLLKFSSQRPF